VQAETGAKVPKGAPKTKNEIAIMASLRHRRKIDLAIPVHNGLVRFENDEGNGHGNYSCFDEYGRELELGFVDECTDLSTVLIRMNSTDYYNQMVTGEAFRMRTYYASELINYYELRTVSERLCVI
jgi:hypothetical protein